MNTKSPEMRQKAKRIVDFGSKWSNTLLDNGFNSDYRDRLTDISYYKKQLKKGKIGSDEKIMKILTHKQFFSIPWLLCFKDYLT